MAKRQFLLPDPDQDRLLQRACKQGLSSTGPARTAASLVTGTVSRRESSGASTDLEDFFERCSRLEGPGVEPDWKQHLAVMNESRSLGVSQT